MGSASIQKYIVYAIGEIALVVIGILIALQVNNWNEERRDQTRLKKHYQEIINELEVDKNNLDELIEIVRQINQGTYIISEFINTDAPVRDTIVMETAFLQSEVYSFFSVSNSAYATLISSGDIQLLDNTELKRLLSIYYNTSNWDWTAHNGSLKLIIEKYAAYIHRFLPPLFLRDQYIQSFSGQLKDEMFSTYEPGGLKQIDFNQLKKDKEFKTIISQLITYRVFQLYFYHDLLDKINEIRNIIQMELKE